MSLWSLRIVFGSFVIFKAQNSECFLFYLRSRIRGGADMF